MGARMKIPKLTWKKKAAGIGIGALLLASAAAYAQTGFLLINPTIQGHPAGAGPTSLSLSNCSPPAAPIGDFSGNCTASAATPTITFAAPYLNPPNCVVTPSTGPTATMAYTVTTAHIAVTGVTGTPVITWNCIAAPGG